MSGGDGIPCGVRCARGICVLAAVIGIAGASAGALWKHLTQPSQSQWEPPLGIAVDRSTTGPIRAKQLEAEAFQVADGLIERFPQSPEALTLAGSTFYAFGRHNKADHVWEKALKLNPGYAPTLEVAGEAAWEHGDYDRAIEYMQRAILADSGMRGKLAFYLADAQINLGNTADAIETLEQAAAEGPLSSDSLFLLGHAYLQTGRYDRSRKLLESALSAEPQSSKIHFGLAAVYRHLGEQEKSRWHREEYARLMAKRMEESTRGRDSLRERDLADPRPLTATCYLNAGKIYALYGDVENAEKHWLRAIEVQPQGSVARKWLALLYAEQGRRAEALQIRQNLALAQPRAKGE